MFNTFILFKHLFFLENYTCSNNNNYGDKLYMGRLVQHKCHRACQNYGQGAAIYRRKGKSIVPFNELLKDFNILMLINLN